MQSYLGSDAYARSKLLNILWAFALARRFEERGVVANAVDPRTAWTSMTAGMEPRMIPRVFHLFWPLLRLFQRARSAENSARSSIFLASAPEAANITGRYVESNARPGSPAATALDRASRKRTWELTAALVANAPTAVPVGAKV